MPQKKAVTPWEKEFARLERRRRAYQARHARPPESRLDRALEDKVPPKLRGPLTPPLSGHLIWSSSGVPGFWSAPLMPRRPGSSLRSTSLPPS